MKVSPKMSRLREGASKAFFSTTFVVSMIDGLLFDKLVSLRVSVLLA